jgi:hypothetical protein
VASFWTSLDNSFINWDDNKYVADNPQIRNLSWDGLKSVFSSMPLTSYVPLTLLSFSLDYSIWGLNPFGYHLTNLVLHVANTGLVFVMVLRLVGAMWPALVSALLFGVHPLHVESVAWVSERKDVLSTLFFWERWSFTWSI